MVILLWPQVREEEEIPVSVPRPVLGLVDGGDGEDFDQAGDFKDAFEPKVN